MENYLSYVEPFFSLSWLVSVGDWYASKCADIGGEWVQAADNTYSCISTNFDRLVADFISNLGDRG